MFKDILEDILKYTGYYFVFKPEDVEKQKIMIYKMSYKKHAILNLQEFLSIYDKCLFLKDTEAKDFLLLKINAIKKWVDNSDKDKYDIGRIDEVFTKDDKIIS